MSGLPRWLHAGAWWVWAIGLAAAASRTTNPWYLAAIVVVLALVVDARKPDAPWAGAFSAAVRLGLFIIVIRLFLQAFVGASVGSTVLVELPSVPMPDWMAGVRLGGIVTVESLLIGLTDGLRLATLVMCFGAASSLASPSRLLKSLPPALYELGVAVVVAMTFAPQLVVDARRISQARRLRGRPHSGIRGLASMAGPVFESALERSVTLAAAMDSRGYGRSAAIPRTTHRITQGLLLVSCVAMCIGMFGLLDSGTPAVVAMPLLGLGALTAFFAIRLAGRRTVRTRYRPDPWDIPEWLVSLSGAVVGIGFVAAAMLGEATINPSFVPLAWPGVAPVGLLVFIALLPLLAAPALPSLDGGPKASTAATTVTEGAR
jgi:energy-coupling factor transport system permease protein